MRKNYFLRSVFLLTALLCGSLFGWSQTYEYTGTGTFEKITSVDDLETGYYVITADNKAMQSILSRKINTEIVSFNDDYSVVTDPQVAAVWKIESIGEGKYCLLNSSEKYLKYGSSTNFVNTGGDINDEKSQYTISYNNGFIIANVATSDRCILFNSAGQFAPYSKQNIGANGYTTPQLYKLKTAGGEDLLSPELAFTDITGNITKLLADGSYSSAATSVSDAAIDYSSSNQEVATIDTDGLVTLVAGGTTIIKAEVPQTSVYKAAAVQYTLTVKAPAVIASEVTFNDWSKVQGSGSGYAAYAGDQIFVGSDGKDYTWNFNDVMLSTTPETKGWPQVKKSSGTLVSPAFETENGFTYTITFNGDGDVTLNGSDGETITGPSPLTFTTTATNCSVTLSNPTATTYIEKIVINASAPAVVTYPLHITLPNSEEGTLRVLNGDTEVTDGENVAENTVLTVVAEPAAGYELNRILVNGVALETNVNTFTLTQETTVSAEFSLVTLPYCTYEGNASGTNGRYVRNITMNGGISPFSIPVHSTTMQAIYVDKTTEVFEAYAGEEIQPAVNWEGSWMHGYLYIDYNKDYIFSYTLGSDNYPTADGELVSYTFYSPNDTRFGYNSKREVKENNSSLDNLPSFTLPGDLAPGEYRVRLKIDWCHLDPCGHPDEIDNTLTANDGNIVDFTLRIVERPVIVSYPLHITLPNSEEGTLRVLNGDTEVTDGENVAENTVLTVVAEPAAGYELNRILVNGVALETNVNTFTLTQETTVAAEFEKAVSAYCTYEGNTNSAQRFVRNIEMVGGASPFSLPVYSEPQQPVYADKTDNIFVAYAGTEIQPIVQWEGYYMHGYFYIDYNKDYQFSYTVDSNGYPTADSEIVSYTFYNPNRSETSGFNSKGEVSRNNSKLNSVPSFTLPDDLAPGDYRVRLKIDWNHLDPCGHPEEEDYKLTIESGNIVDFTLRIVERPATYTVTLPETVENGTLTVMNGSAALVPGANTVEENSELTITAEPAQGYRLESLTVNGSAFTSGDTYTVTGNTEIAVSFAEIPVVTHIITYSVKQGEGTITLSNLEGTETYQSGASLRADKSFKITFSPAEDYTVEKVMYGPTSFGAIMELTLDENNSYTMPVEQFVGNYTFEAYFTYDPGTGIAENDREAISARYANGVLHVEGVTEGEFELCIYNLTGKPVRTATETVVDVADLAKGCYLVKVTTAEAEEVVKFIKK